MTPSGSSRKPSALLPREPARCWRWPGWSAVAGRERPTPAQQSGPDAAAHEGHRSPCECARRWPMTSARRAMPDAVCTLAAYVLSALWLSSLSGSGLVLQLAGLGAGALVAGAAVASVLRRIPRFSTPADRVTLLRAVLVVL